MCTRFTKYCEQNFMCVVYNNSDCFKNTRISQAWLDVEDVYNFSFFRGCVSVCGNWLQSLECAPSRLSNSFSEDDLLVYKNKNKNKNTKHSAK